VLSVIFQRLATHRDGIIRRLPLPPSAVTYSILDIRRACLDDARGIEALESLFTTDLISLRSIRRFLRVPTASVWVATLDGLVVGNLISLTRRGSDRARIYSVVVAPAARGQRVAERMIRAAEAEAAAAGLRRMTLEVAVDNVPAQALYAKLGYQQIAELEAYYEDGGDGLRLMKPLA
jgi:ribosomal protein S18 acetylase RimI-like enzyme